MTERIDHRKSKLLRFITAGSVDDGKSTLIGRLLHDSKAIFEDQLAAVARTTRRRGLDGLDLSLLTDGLQAEREQGITIDVAYRYFDTPKRKFIIADTPGHEQYTRNMVTGASTANLAVVLVDARKGVVTQSRRHIYIAHLLGIRHLVVAVNKMDLVGYDQGTFARICAEFQKFVSNLDFRDVIFVPLSALRGDMVVERGNHLTWYDGKPLLELLETIAIDEDLNLDDFRFPVQWVCRPSVDEFHDFRGYMGRIESGIISTGDAVTVLPAGGRSRIKKILTYDGELQRAHVPQSVTLLLDDPIDVARGDMIVKAHDQPQVLREFTAELCWFSEQAAALGRRYVIKHTSRSGKAVLTGIDYRIDVDTLDRVAGVTGLHMNDMARVSFKAQQPLVIDAYARNRVTGSFIVINEANNNTVAAGMIQASISPHDHGIEFRSEPARA